MGILRQARDISVKLICSANGRDVETILHVDGSGCWRLEGEADLVATIGRESYNEWLIDLWSQTIPSVDNPISFYTELSKAE